MGGGPEVLGCVFSVEMKSKRHVKNISISDEAHDLVLFEGDIGSVLEMSLVESSVLEIVGENGVLRIDVDTDMLLKVFESPDQTLRLGSEVGSHTSTKKT